MTYMKMAINAYLAGYQGTEHRQSVTSFSNVSLIGGASRLQVTSSKNRKFGHPSLGGRSLSSRFCASQGNVLR